MVGTAMNTVKTPLAIRFHTTLASKRVIISQVAPDQSAQETTLIIP